MRYNNLQEAVFLKRPNRFRAHIRIHGEEEICHVKNTGRLGELLLPGVRILVEPAAPGSSRKTKYSLICVRRDGQWVNIDSQAPNRLAQEWIADGGFLKDVTLIRREKQYGGSRFDLYVEAGGEKWYIEVKGVTLNVDGTAMFPDAPTERGKKHVEELIACRKDGYRSAILFVIQMKGVQRFAPFEERQPEFAAALRQAEKAGVVVRAVDCIVTGDSIHIDTQVPVCL